MTKNRQLKNKSSKYSFVLCTELSKPEDTLRAPSSPNPGDSTSMSPSVSNQPNQKSPTQTSESVSDESLYGMLFVSAIIL